MKKFILMCALLVSGTANAGLVELKWTTTASQLTGSVPGVVGEAITTIFSVDNGGSSIFSQSWDMGDFVSYRIEGASGWWIESDFISAGAGLFSTDGVGNVISAATWIGGYPTATITTSWAGIVNGGWWNNGSNEVVCSASATDCVWATNVAANIVGSSWTATAVVSAVPEPATIALLALGLAGLGFSRTRKSA